MSLTSDDIHAIRAWMEKQPHQISRLDDQFIATFLHCCKYRLEETKSRIEAYLTSKTIYPDLLKNRHINEAILEILRSGLFLIPPKRLEGPRLFIMQLAYYSPKKHNLSLIFKLQFMLYELLAFEDDYSSINGIETIYDLKNCTLSQVLRFDPVILKKTYIYVEQCMPMKQIRVHVVNLNTEFYGVFKFAKTILPSNIPFEIVWHEKEEDMFRYFPRASISSDYGGYSGSKAEFIKEWEVILKDHAKYFAEDSTYGTNEALRREYVVNLQTDFGVEGSFRKLEID